MRPSIMIVVSLVLGLDVSLAAASPCSDEIAKLEQAIQQSGNNPAAAPTARQSVGAQLGYQPTPESVRDTELASKKRLVAILNRAKAFAAKGKSKKCMELVATARLRLQ